MCRLWVRGRSGILVTAGVLSLSHQHFPSHQSHTPTSLSVCITQKDKVCVCVCVTEPSLSAVLTVSSPPTCRVFWIIPFVLSAADNPPDLSRDRHKEGDRQAGRPGPRRHWGIWFLITLFLCGAELCPQLNTCTTSKLSTKIHHNCHLVMMEKIVLQLMFWFRTWMAWG